MMMMMSSMRVLLSLGLVLAVAVCGAQSALQPVRESGVLRGVQPTDGYCGKTGAKDLWALQLEQGMERRREASPMTLKQVSVLIRHGDRMNNGDCWPNDDANFQCASTHASVPNTKPSETTTVNDRLYRKVYLPGRNLLGGSSNCSSFQLTTHGQAQQHENGRILAQAYVGQGKLLPAQYTQENASRFFLRSDDVPRTILSAESLFYGMYPSISASEGAQVIDMHTMDIALDDMSPNSRICPELKKQSDEMMQSEGWLQHMKTVTQPLQAQLGSVLGLPSDNLNVIHIFDCMHTHVCHNFSLPDGFTQELFDAVVTESNWQTQYQYWYHNYTFAGRLLIGSLVNEVFQAMQLKTTGSSDAKDFLLYSGHDSTLAPFLSALGVWDGLWPPYASMIVMELWQYDSGDQSYAVRLMYNGKELKMPGCKSTLCSFDEFARIAAELNPTAAQCGLSSSDQGNALNPPSARVQRRTNRKKH